MGMWTIGYEDYLIERELTDDKENYIDYLTECCGIGYIDALRAANDCDYGYEE